jgi:ankyrin repeat protein
VRFVACSADKSSQILLVPPTELLLTSTDKDTNIEYKTLAGTEEFIGSHVLRIPPESAQTIASRDADPKAKHAHIRENRGKAKAYNTINNRTVIVKDGMVFANKGFKTLNQAQLLGDALFYSDAVEPRAWLVYYISKPLLGTPVDTLEHGGGGEARQSNGTLTRLLPGDFSTGIINDAPSIMPKKKDIKTFNDLLNHFPVIARHMQPGLEKLFKEFNHVFEKPLPPPPSADHIPDPVPQGPITKVVKHARSNSTSLLSPRGTLENGTLERTMTGLSYIEDDEQIMRGALETAVMSAQDLFQSVDKDQLSKLGAQTDLTGPMVERLIERYVTEQLHDQVLYPKLCALKRPEDLELESKIRHMENIDVSQVGIAIEGGQEGKREFTARLGKAVEEFRKMGVAGSPQQMMDILLSTLKAVTNHGEETQPQTNGTNGTSEKISPIVMMNADTLVSLLLVVVIRSNVKFLQARLLYMRHFIFMEDVESGEMGYALSTFEAVLSYLQRDSGGLRKASRRNKKLWEAAVNGDVKELKNIMEPERCESPEEMEDETPWKEASPRPWHHINGSSHTVLSRSAPSRLSEASTLAHVFPFEARSIDEEAIEDDHPLPPAPKRKSVKMDTRSLSIHSEYSFRSRATTIDSMGSGIEGDTSIERLSQTEDLAGESVLMMAVQNKKPAALKYLLCLEEYYPLSAILSDANNDGVTLLSAAVQTGMDETIDLLLERLRETDQKTLMRYLAKQDVRGRSVGHHLYSAPRLIGELGRLIPWRQKDRLGQTPLFALARSYDNSNYVEMVTAGLIAAAASQTDGERLHLDHHTDSKGNTLLHIVNEPILALRILYRCEPEVNAANDKKFTPLMMASKYARTEMVRVLFGDARTDIYAREQRGFTAVELAKDDETRNRMDDLVLFSAGPAGEDGRLTSVVRAFFVEDQTVRCVLKSGAPSVSSATGKGASYTVTTCRRSVADFEGLARLLSLECPASWIPTFDKSLRTPYQISSKPSRAALADTKQKLDAWLRLMLAHPSFRHHEMLWEFVLVPDIKMESMETRAKAKAEARLERIRDEVEPVEDVEDVDRYVQHARDMVRQTSYATKTVLRRVGALNNKGKEMAEAGAILMKAVRRLEWLPATHVKALDVYVASLGGPTIPPAQQFHSTLLTINSTLIALLLSLSRPQQIVDKINNHTSSLTKNYATLSRSTRWPLGILDDTRLRLDKEKENTVAKEEEVVGNLRKELRETQTVVAGELAGWQNWKEGVVRQGVRELVRGMVVLERGRLEGLKRAIRCLKPPVEEETVGQEQYDAVVREEQAWGVRL